MSCSWCGKTISVFRALTNSKYCCAQHQDDEREHIKRLAMERLLSAAPNHPKLVNITRTETKPEARSGVTGSSDTLIPRLEISGAR